MIDTGVASPRAQGLAMMSTATALINACAIFGSGPKMLHTMKVIMAAPTTAGTK
jgi:hypothetical protein